MLGKVKQYAVKPIAARHDVDAGDLNRLINKFHLFEQMPKVVQRRKQYQDIDKTASKLLALLEDAELGHHEDTMLDIRRDNHERMRSLPAPTKGPDKGNRDALIHQLAGLYGPDRVSLSRDNSNLPFSPFLSFCHDVFQIADPHTTDEAIANVLVKYLKK